MNKAASVPKRAFTLIELLVVVGIIGLLMAIALPSMKGARNAARKSQVKVQLNAIKQALEMFRNDVGKYVQSATGNFRDPLFDSSHPDMDNIPTGYTLNDAPLSGAQWLIRGLMGRDLRGYVNPKRARKEGYRDPGYYYDFEGCNTCSQAPREKLAGDRGALASP